MFVLAHTGLTLGAAVLITGALTSNRPSQVMESGVTIAPRHSSKSVLSRLTFPLRQASSWLTILGNRIDIRLLLIGALLPDIIDKPIAYLFFRETSNSGRIFSHTLLFLIVITLLGLFVYRRWSKLWLLVLAFGTMTHLILDQMWQTPRTLLWPFFVSTLHCEAAFHTGDASYAAETSHIPDIMHWISSIVDSLVTDPTQYVPELIGAVIIVWFVWILLRRKKALLFIRSGRIQ
jgi:inner membrane protein